MNIFYQKQNFPSITIMTFDLEPNGGPTGWFESPSYLITAVITTYIYVFAHWVRPKYNIIISVNVSHALLKRCYLIQSISNEFCRAYKPHLFPPCLHLSLQYLWNIPLETDLIFFSTMGISKVYDSHSYIYTQKTRCLSWYIGGRFLSFYAINYHPSAVNAVTSQHLYWFAGWYYSN